MYSDEMVERWNKEIDTLLVYVRLNADRLPDYTERFRCCLGGFVLRSTDRIQRPVISAPHPSTGHRPGYHRP